MYSDGGNRCSHRLGFPIRKSPDHSLLAASRSLSQLTTSFFAYLRQGIHTHALSSLTIKSTSHTIPAIHPPHSLSGTAPASGCTVDATFFALTFKTCVLYARQYSVVKDLDCVSNQLNQGRLNKLLDGGPGWTRTTDLILIRDAL